MIEAVLEELMANVEPLLGVCGSLTDRTNSKHAAHPTSDFADFFPLCSICKSIIPLLEKIDQFKASKVKRKRCQNKTVSR